MSLRSGVSSLLTAFARVKPVDFENIQETKLARCLNTFDLTALGIGSTLGAGIYVVAGQVAKEHAGPSVVISFLIAAAASILAGLCYAEFGARVPKTGSAYVYTYVTVGELLAFIIGWNLILEYVIGTASVASAWSNYFDSLINKQIGNFFNETMHMDVSFLGPYPDFFAFGITLVLTAVLAFGVRESSTFNNIFTGLNLIVVLYSVITGAFKADSHNWSLPPREVNGTQVDAGGFMPFGFSQMLAGASTCFYAFVGFDAIATTGEEVKNPQKAIPVSIIGSLLACCVAYCSVAVILTLMIPYYDMDDSAPLPLAFKEVGYPVAQWIISIGAIAGLSTSLLGAMFPLPRILYAMASDGLIFKFLATISERFKTPVIATVISGIFAGVMAAMFALQELVDMMSIGTLMAYTLVATSVLLLRYKIDPTDDEESHELQSSSSEQRKCFQTVSAKPTKDSQRKVAIAIFCIVIASVLMGLAVMFMGTSSSPYLWILFCVGAVGLVLCTAFIYTQPQSKKCVTFKVPFLPIVGALSASVNIILMLKLSSATWIRFGVWMALGFIIYFGYGIWHSEERICTQERKKLINNTANSED